MACFVVPAAEAVVVTIAEKVAEKKEKKQEASGNGTAEAVSKIPFSTKLKWLRNLLWGGVLLLAFEHVWHGEVVPWFPFLTGAEDPAAMIGEMLTVGVMMAVFVTAVWLAILGVVYIMEKRESRKPAVG